MRNLADEQLHDGVRVLLAQAESRSWLMLIYSLVTGYLIHEELGSGWFAWIIIVVQMMFCACMQGIYLLLRMNMGELLQKVGLRLPQYSLIGIVAIAWRDCRVFLPLDHKSMGQRFSYSVRREIRLRLEQQRTSTSPMEL